MARKRNPENDLIVTPGAAATRPHRTSARPKHVPATAEIQAPPAASVNRREPSHDEIRALAHSYWEARGCQGGSPEEDWRRAEAELRQQTLAAV